MLHLVVSNDDIVSHVGNLSDGDWYHVNIEFGQGFYVLQGKVFKPFVTNGIFHLIWYPIQFGLF